MNKVPISVIIPTYNRADLLKGCLTSILQQSVKPAEIVVIDDGSNDHTEEVVKSYDGVSYHVKEHSGIAKTLNYGLSKVTQPMLTFLDSDDLWEPDFIKVQYENLIRSKNIDGVFCHHRRFYDYPVHRLLTPAERNEEMRIYPAKLKAGMLIATIPFMSVGLFNETIKQGDFIDWYMRAIERGIKFKMVKDCLMKRRIHENNITSDRSTNSSNLLKVIASGLQRRRRSKK
jgi:glycosyltransferase involved in cell wall biosynthesis